MSPIIDTARRYLGTAEFPGAKSSPAVEAFFARAGHPGLTDDVPWCAAFVGAVLAEGGHQPSGSLMARSYLDWGVHVPPAEARPGDVVIFKRGKPPQGHVALFLSWDDTRVRVIGGNQRNRAAGSDEVTEAPFPIDSILGIRRADAASAMGRATVQMGDRGAMVTDLQQQLATLRYFAGRLDGAFGALTRTAVLAFQADNGLATDGVVGPQTWTALRGAPPRPDRDVSAGDLRREGSATIRNADLTDGVATVGAAGVTVEAIREAVDTAEGARGTLDWLGTWAAANWPLALALVAIVGVFVLTRRIRSARINDARSGAHVGR